MPRGQRKIHRQRRMPTHYRQRIPTRRYRRITIHRQRTSRLPASPASSVGLDSEASRPQEHFLIELVVEKNRVFAQIKSIRPSVPVSLSLLSDIFQMIFFTRQNRRSSLQVVPHQRSTLP